MRRISTKLACLLAIAIPATATSQAAGKLNAFGNPEKMKPAPTTAAISSPTPMVPISAAMLAPAVAGIIVAEYKQPNPAAKERGLSLFTSTFRCSSPNVFDLRLNSHSRLNLIQALIQAIDAGADEALMLDPHGFVASCNSTNFFVVRKGELWTSTGRFNFKGITRGKIVAAARERGMPVFEKDFTLAETWSADEAFVTGTLGGVTPVTKIDGRTIAYGNPGAWTGRIAEWYRSAVMG